MIRHPSRDRLCGALAALLCLWVAPRALADVRLDVRTDRTRLSLDETLTLQINVEAQGMGRPRVELPTFDGFQVVSQQVQQPMQFSLNFGSQAVVQSSTIYILGLQPVREGTLVIKPVRAEFDGQVKTSRPIEIVVTGSGGSGNSPGRNAQAPQATGPDPRGARAQPGRRDTVDSAEIDSMAFLRTVVDKAEPYEGEQVTVTIYLYSRERLQAAPDIATEPTTDGLWTHDLLPPNQAFRPDRQVVGNSVYAVYVLRRFAAFPLHAGDITVGPMALEIDTTSLFDMFAPGRARPNLKRSSAPVTLKVKPLPAADRPPGEIAVGRYQVSAKLDRTQVVTGDAVTLTAVVEGQGNIRTVQLKAPKVPGIEFLQPDIKDLVEAPNDLVSGRREYRWLLLAREPGRLTIPALSIATFDPRAERYEMRASPPLVLEAMGQARAPSDARVPQPELRDAAHPEGLERHDWAPIRTQSKLIRSPQRLVETGWFGWALAAPLVLWLAVVSFAGVRRRLSARADAGAARALRGAELRLRAAERAAAAGDSAAFYAHASAAISGILDARLEEPVAGLTRPQLRALLQARGMEQDLIDSVVQTLQDCEFARFGSAPLSSSELGSQAQALNAFFRRLATFKPMQPGDRPEAA